MIGAGVLALPTVTAPAGFLPSSAALLAVWAYMATTALLISEATISTACALGRPSGISLLSLGENTLGRPGAILTAISYTILHYAILTAYTAQGAATLNHLLPVLEQFVHLPIATLPPAAAPALFAAAIGIAMYALSPRTVERLNNALVAAVVATFLAVVYTAGSHTDLTTLLAGSHWGALPHGGIIPVLFVSCVYHNVVSTITMRLEGDRAKIRRVIFAGSAVPLGMFLLYDAAMLGGGGSTEGLAVTGFSLLAVATSFVGFVEGLTGLWADVRLTRGTGGGRWMDFVATILPPIVFTVVQPDVFLDALDAAGTYGIAVLFGGLPAAMAWQIRRKGETVWKGVGGGDAVLAMVGIVPVLLIGSKVLGGLGVG